MSTEKIAEQLIYQIQSLAGQFGELMNSEPVDPSDAESYDFQVMTGLARATVEIIDFDPAKLFAYLEYCIIDLGLRNMDHNPRISALKDALENEVHDRLVELRESEKGLS